MSEIKSIDVQEGKMDIKLSITQNEYKILQHHTEDILVLPSGRDSLVNSLTTGKLGNSNRIMVPKKLLELHNIRELDKKVPSGVFVVDGDAFLLIKIKKSGLGMPKFGEE